MPNVSQINQFRRLVGDFKANKVTDNEIVTYLNDAVWEVTSHNYATPIGVFDSIAVTYQNELIWKAAINYWWNEVAILQAKLTTTVGQASQNVSELWTRALSMIQVLQAQYDEIQQLGITIIEGNSSRFSKQSLRRIGGVEEEDTPIPAPFSGLNPYSGNWGIG